MLVESLTLPLASFLSPSFGELALVGVIALLLYGSDLPQVIRGWGKTYNDLRRNLNGIRNDLNDVIYSEPDSPRKLQYYPEFQHDKSEAASESAGEGDSPVAKVAAIAEAETAAEPDTQIAASDDTVRHDAHGAA
ncbi:MAG: twin-arginine translocase TatA/TatE family subunit [Pirellulales bacterium]|nr:twin-arginine translocase TatA/TatE family subunit [Pirellulales bacterium]